MANVSKTLREERVHFLTALFEMDGDLSAREASEILAQAYDGLGMGLGKIFPIKRAVVEEGKYDAPPNEVKARAQEFLNKYRGKESTMAKKATEREQPQQISAARKGGKVTRARGEGEAGADNLLVLTGNPTELSAVKKLVTILNAKNGMNIKEDTQTESLLQTVAAASE